MFTISYNSASGTFVIHKNGAIVRSTRDASQAILQLISLQKTHDAHKPEAGK